MTRIRLGMLAAGMAVSMAAGAQTWSTNFDNPADRDGSFDSVVTAGVYEDFAGDGVLALYDPTTASFTFTTLAPTPYFLVTFWTSTSGGIGHGGNVAVSLGGQTESFVVPNPGNIGPNPNPAGAQYSYHYGTSGTPWAAGVYTLNFDNAPAAGFRLDDVSVSAVPEPSSYIMAMTGLAGVGFLMARRRKDRTGQ